MLKGVVKVWSEYCLHQISQRQRPRSRASVVPFCPGNQWRVSSGFKMTTLAIKLSEAFLRGHQVLGQAVLFPQLPPPKHPSTLRSSTRLDDSAASMVKMRTPPVVS